MLITNNLWAQDALFFSGSEHIHAWQEINNEITHATPHKPIVSNELTITQLISDSTREQTPSKFICQSPD